MYPILKGLMKIFYSHLLQDIEAKFTLTYIAVFIIFIILILEIPVCNTYLNILHINHTSIHK